MKPKGRDCRKKPSVLHCHGGRLHPRCCRANFSVIVRGDNVEKKKYIAKNNTGAALSTFIAGRKKYIG